jgi:hypothetical protein
MGRFGTLDVVVTAMFLAPAVGVAVLLGVAFGWQLPVAFALAFGLLIAVSAMRDRKVGRGRAAIEFVGLTLAGGVVGGLLLGGLGAIFGLVFGFMARLAQIPTTR